jgi:hypothetical protein
LIASVRGVGYRLSAGPVMAEPDAIAIPLSRNGHAAKVTGQACLICGRRPVDPAHLVPRSLGGCNHPDCVVPLCRPCHRGYDRGQLDLLPHLEPRHRAELAHALTHMPLIGVLTRVTGVRWAPE